MDIYTKLHDALALQCARLHKSHLTLPRDYSLAIRTSLPSGPKGSKTNVIVLSGETPTIVVSTDFLFSIGGHDTLTVDGIRNQKESRRLFEMALLAAIRLVPRMKATLALVPIADAIALRNGLSKWKKASKARQAIEIPSRYFTETYSVTVTCSLTGESSIRHGVSPSELSKVRKDMQLDLSARALSDPEIVEILEASEVEKTYRKEYRAEKALLSTNKRGVDVSFTHSDDDLADSVKDAPKTVTLT